MTLSELFPKPPFMVPARVDRDCERLIIAMLQEKYGTVSFPAPTDALTRLIEREVGDFDLYADLSEREGDPEGVTDHFIGAKPQVFISERLSEGSSENRLRTTLAHEFGHVVLHDPLVQGLAGPKLISYEGQTIYSGNRATPEGEPKGDLVEYQAWYFCGALLMPKSFVVKLVADAMEDAGLYTKPYQHSEFGQKLKAEVAQAFGVSDEAARIRLLKLKLITESEPDAALF